MKGIESTMKTIMKGTMEIKTFKVHREILCVTRPIQKDMKSSKYAMILHFYFTHYLIFR